MSTCVGTNDTLLLNNQSMQYHTTLFFWNLQYRLITLYFNGKRSIHQNDMLFQYLFEVERNLKHRLIYYVLLLLACIYKCAGELILHNIFLLSITLRHSIIYMISFLPILWVKYFYKIHVYDTKNVIRAEIVILSLWVKCVCQYN